MLSRRAWRPKNFRRPARWAATSLARNNPRKARENVPGQDKVCPARYPPRAINGGAAARHDHVDMGMMGQRRAPGVKHRGDADAGAEVLGSAAMVVMVSAEVVNRMS